MRILIDADGCPVVDITVGMAKKNGIKCFILCDTAHFFERGGAETITVSKGADSVDFALVNLVHPGDIVITQDYGLAAMCLARRAVVVSQDGMVYSDSNITELLEQRAMAAKVRRSGGCDKKHRRLSGLSKRTEAQNRAFEAKLQELILAK